MTPSNSLPWVRSPLVVAYYTGHGGDLLVGTYYLVSKKSRPADLGESALAAQTSPHWLRLPPKMPPDDLHLTPNPRQADPWSGVFLPGTCWGFSLRSMGRPADRGGDLYGLPTGGVGRHSFASRGIQAGRSRVMDHVPPRPTESRRCHLRGFA